MMVENMQAPTERQNWEGPMAMAQLPRVTEILREAGLIDTTWFTERGANRGTAVHAACQFLDEGDLDLMTLDPQIEGYVRAYDAWRHDSGIMGAEWIECPRQDPMGLYRGTPDRVLVTRLRAVWDLKTGGYQTWVSLQLAAYVNMLPDPYSYSRYGLYLSANGTYTVKEFPKTEYAADLSVFLSALNIVNWKRRANGNRK